MKNFVSILIPNRFSWDGVCLTIESIRKRTVSTNYDIIICDNSMAPNERACEPPRNLPDGADDGSRLDYLREQARLGNIRLIENIGQARKYGHGENVRIMLDQVETQFAMLFNSTSEILRADWLDILISMIRDPDHDLGVARFRAGGAREYDYITPSYWPNMMLLNMPLYRKFYPENNWDLEQIGLEDFHRPELFTGQIPRTPDRTPPLVFADTGWRLWEKLEYDNPVGLTIIQLPENYWNTYIKWHGGIDRNSYRPEHPYVMETLAKINERLAVLRAE